MITTRWFSSSLSDPASRRTPCPPKIRRWRLQVSLSVSRLSPLCLTSLSIPFHHLRPVRHYPHLWISARGLELSGTSTHLTRQLSGTHYGPLRHPSAPGLSLAGVRLIIPDHALGFPVLRALSLCTCCRHYPGAADGRSPRSKFTHPCQPSHQQGVSRARHIRGCAVAPVVAVQAQGQATQARELSTLAPLRVLRARTSDPARPRHVVGEGVRSCPRAQCGKSACCVR